MNRNLITDLENWKDSPLRQPLILKGARQVGKTYLLKEFARTSFSKFHYFNFEETTDLSSAFEGNLDIDTILRSLRLDRKSLEQNRELVIFDEIQSCPKALNSLKYFAENAPKIFIAAAGSLIGVTLAQESFPVGKVDYLYLTPMKFSEYLAASDPFLRDVLRQLGNSSINNYEHLKLLQAFNDYSVIGGLPRGILIAQEFLKQPQELDKKLGSFHDDMIRTYQSDFAKHAGRVNAVHISDTFTHIPMQLASNTDASTKRFIFKDVVPGLRGYAQLSGPIAWLCNASLAYKVKIARKASYPLESYASENLFKLYLFDTGLLFRMLRVPYEVAAKNNYGMHKGFAMENLILTQVVQDELSLPYCWQENKAEVDFLQIVGSDIVPIEVKSSHRKASKSLSSYINRYKPNSSIRFSTNQFHFNKEKKIIDIPIYAAELIQDLCEHAD